MIIARPLWRALRPLTLHSLKYRVELGTRVYFRVWVGSFSLVISDLYVTVYRSLLRQLFIPADSRIVFISPSPPPCRLRIGFPYWKQTYPADGRDGHRLFSEGCRREDEADRSLRVILASATGAFNPELLPLSNVRGFFCCCSSIFVCWMNFLRWERGCNIVLKWCCVQHPVFRKILVVCWCPRSLATVVRCLVYCSRWGGIVRKRVWIWVVFAFACRRIGSGVSLFWAKCPRSITLLIINPLEHGVWFGEGDIRGVSAQNGLQKIEFGEVQVQILRKGLWGRSSAFLLYHKQ